MHDLIHRPIGELANPELIDQIMVPVIGVGIWQEPPLIIIDWLSSYAASQYILCRNCFYKTVTEWQDE